MILKLVKLLAASAAFAIFASPTSGAALEQQQKACVFVDSTAPDVQARLEGKTLLLSSPIQVSRNGSTKVSKGRFVVLDAKGKALGMAEVSCSLACTGQACMNSGCDATPQGACTPHECGTGCTGTCTKSSSYPPLDD